MRLRTPVICLGNAHRSVDVSHSNQGKNLIYVSDDLFGHFLNEWACGLWREQIINLLVEDLDVWEFDYEFIFHFLKGMSWRFLPDICRRKWTRGPGAGTQGLFLGYLPWCKSYLHQYVRNRARSLWSIIQSILQLVPLSIDRHIFCSIWRVS